MKGFLRMRREMWSVLSEFWVGIVSFGNPICGAPCMMVRVVENK